MKTKKNEYIVKSEKERLKYHEELDKYKNTDSYKEFQKKLIEHKKSETCKSSQKNKNNTSKLADETFLGDIPIFTKEFLEHNKEREADLRRLRLEVSRLEEEDKCLTANVSRLKSACLQSEGELSGHKDYMETLSEQTICYTKALIDVFGSLTIPGYPNGLTKENIEAYMSKVHDIVTHARPENQSIISKLKDSAKRFKIRIPDC